MTRLKCASITFGILAFGLISLWWGLAWAQERFIDNGDGTVTDTETHLMWAKYDNMGNLNWHRAQDYCENVILSKDDDWRMPTIEELATLYNRNEKGYESHCGNWVRVNPMIHLSCGWVWAIDAKTISAYAFNFSGGYRYTDRMVHKRNYRALPVRTIK